MNQYKYLIKFILIGESGVGKSAMLNMYTEEFFNKTYSSTIGIDFKTKLINIDQNIIKLQIWDTAGQEKFHSITQSYFSGANAIILVFDLTNLSTLNKLEMWINKISNLKTEDSYRLLLVGNKADEEKIREVNKDHISKFLEKNPMPYLEVSAKENTNVKNAFEILAEKTFYDLIIRAPKSKKNISPGAGTNSSYYSWGIIENDKEKCC